jgi:SAM-dependent methyltransferase
MAGRMSWLRRVRAGLLSRRVASLPRGQYKAVWSRLSKSEESAKHYVLGTGDEAVVRQSAESDLAKLQRALHIRPEDDVLEIGCGVGRLGAVVAPVCRTWTGCDVSPHMLAHAARRLRGLTNVSLTELSGYDLGNVPSASMDVIYSTVVFMHLSEWDRYSYVEEAHRVLRPGGRLYIDNVALNTGHGWKVFQESRAVPPARRPPYLSSVSTVPEFETYLEKAGFTRVDVQIVADAWVVGVGVK